MELPVAIEAIETDQEYFDTQEAQAQAEQTVDYWLKKANYLNTVSLVFALVLCIADNNHHSNYRL